MSNYLLVVLLVAIQLANLSLANKILPPQANQPYPPSPDQLRADIAPREIVTNNNTNDISYSKNTKTENIAIGNTNNNNFNFQKSDYTPTQLTQVVLNVPKPKKLRISRPPTEEEFAIKKKILDVYENARQEAQVINSIHFNHLGRIIEALNPKYIATERVRRVAFGNPNDPTTIFTIPDVKPQPLSTISLKVPRTTNSNNNDNDDDSIFNQLNQLNKQFRSQVNWDLQFVNLLANTNDKQLTLEQLAFKRLLLCLTQTDFCPQAEENDFLIRQEQEEEVEQQQQLPYRNQQQDDMAVAASEMNQQAVYVPAPQQQFQQPDQQYQPNNQMYLQAQQPRVFTNNMPPFYNANPQGVYPPQQAQQPIPLNNNLQPFRYNRFKNNAYSPPSWIYRQQHPLSKG